MSIDPTGAALARDDATASADAPRTASGRSPELAGIATVIERVEALLAAGGPEHEGSEAIERIADIAFVLHERDVEASLCDALDAAVRELANANAAKQTNVHHVRQAAEMLRELSQRVADMVALLQVAPPPAADHGVGNEPGPEETALEEGEHAAADQLAGEDASDGEIPREGLFPAELLEDDEFARAVAELAASLPALAGPIEAVVVTLHESVDLVAEAPISTPESDETAVDALREPADLAAEALDSASEPAEAVVVALCESTAAVAAEPTSASEPDAGPETQSETSLVAEGELGAAFELKETAETLSEIGPLAADDSARAPEADEPAYEAPHGFAELPAGEPAREQESSPIADRIAIEQTPAEESAIVEIVIEQFAHDDEVPAPNAAAGEPMHDAVLDGSTDHSLVNGHAAVSPADTDALHVTSDTATSPASEAVPDSEAALAPDSAPTAVSEAEPEQPSPSEPLSPVVDDAATNSAAEQLSDRTILRHNGDDKLEHAVNESAPPDADEALARSAAEAKEETPRFAESSQTLLPELALVDPQDDPGDLFEPLAGASPSIAAANFAESQPASKISAHIAEKQARSAAATADPLAAMRTLSAEELLALFT